MIPLEYEIDRLKNIFFEMVDLVRDQLTLTKEALLVNDSDVAGEVMRKESRVNSYELTIDRECEDFLALHSPVAADLRLTIAILKMSGSLERIGDHAYRISSFVYDNRLKLSKDPHASGGVHRSHRVAATVHQTELVRDRGRDVSQADGRV